MRSYHILLLCLAFFMIVPQSCLAKSTGEEPLIRVGLSTQQNQLKLSADTVFFLFSGNNGLLTNTFAANRTVGISNQNGRLIVNGTPITASVVHVSFSLGGNRGHGDRLYQLIAQANAINQQGQYVKLDGKRYRGLLEVRRQGTTGLTAVNILPLEQYLYGVIPKEISPVWPLEAIKAQAVAARSYAFTSTGKHQDHGFDVCSTVHCQVYGGRDSEAVRSNQAVDATRGMMATYRGAVISAFFHSSSGGHTESSENIWGTQIPYLRGVVDYDQKSPRFLWEHRVSATKLAELLRASGSDIGNLTVIELSPLTQQPISVNDRGVSGRVKAIKLIGEAGKVQLSGAKFSTLLGLPSSLFEIAIVGSSLPVTTTSRPTARRFIQDHSRDILVISGSGAGHGIGMSQWGAKAMAERATHGNNLYYKDILAHYYLGITVKKWYE